MVLGPQGASAISSDCAPGAAEDEPLDGAWQVRQPRPPTLCAPSRLAEGAGICAMANSATRITAKRTVAVFLIPACGKSRACRSFMTYIGLKVSDKPHDGA